MYGNKKEDFEHVVYIGEDGVPSISFAFVTS